MRQRHAHSNHSINTGLLCKDLKCPGNTLHFFHVISLIKSFGWQLGAKEGPVDTSATAMILYAIARSLQTNVLMGYMDHRGQTDAFGVNTRLMRKRS